MLLLTVVVVVAAAAVAAAAAAAAAATAAAATAVAVVVGGGCCDRSGSGSTEENREIHKTGNGRVETVVHDVIRRYSRFRIVVVVLLLDSDRQFRLEGVEAEQVLEVGGRLGERHG